MCCIDGRFHFFDVILFQCSVARWEFDYWIIGGIRAGQVSARSHYEDYGETRLVEYFLPSREANFANTLAEQQQNLVCEEEFKSDVTEIPNTECV